MTTSPQSTPELELHGAPTGNCFRAAIGLIEAGLHFDPVRIDLARGGQRSASHLALNPAGKVPALVVRATPGTPAYVLTQSTAILFYADARAPGRILPPNGDSRRLRALEAYFYFTSDVIALNGAAFRLRGPEHSAAAATLTAQCVAAIVDSERFLTDNEFMGSDCFTIADIAAFTVISAMKQQLAWDRLPRMAEWHARIGRRSGIQVGMTAFN